MLRRSPLARDRPARRRLRQRAAATRSPPARPSRPPAADAAILFVSGSWAARGRPAARAAWRSRADGSGLAAAHQLRARVAALRHPAGGAVPRSRPRGRRAHDPGRRGGRQASTSWTWPARSRRSSSRAAASSRPTGRRTAASCSTPPPAPADGQRGLVHGRPDGTERAEPDRFAERARARARASTPSGRTAAFEQIDDGGVSRIYLFRETPITSGPATGPPLPGTPYVVGSDADPTFSPDATLLVFRRLTGMGNGGLGTWDLMVISLSAGADAAHARDRAALPRRPGLGPPRHRVRRDGRRPRHSQLVLVQPDGSGRTVLRTEAAGYRMGAPRWLPCSANNGQRNRPTGLPDDGLTDRSEKVVPLDNGTNAARNDASVERDW